jgi:hypothetical protein
MGTGSIAAVVAREPQWLRVCIGIVKFLLSLAGWIVGHTVLVAAVAAVAFVAWGFVTRKLTLAALGLRTYVELLPSPSFETGQEEVLRQGMQLIRAAGAGPWWTPRAARTVRVRLRADGSKPLSYQLEAPKSARRLLTSTPYARVRVGDGKHHQDKDRKHVVRAVYVLHGDAAAPLREVPLDPDPLQPLLDAVAGLRADHKDLAEVCLDISPASRWRMAARRFQMLQAAREKARRETRREARWMASDATAVEESLLWQLRQILAPGNSGRGSLGAPMLAPRPPRVDASSALGKLDGGTGMVRAQLLVRCASEQVGQAELLLRQIGAALDVFADRSRWSSQGYSLGPWKVGPDRWPWRRGFDERWKTGLIKPGRDSWVHISEIGGLLKPPTRFARLPVMASDLPEYQPRKNLLPQGYYRGADGVERLLATPEAETLFEASLGKAGWGKTERALVQAVAHAHSGGGLGYVDPHRDTWPRVEPYLAHNRVMGRILLLDLTRSDPDHRLPSWNPLSMVGRPPADQVTTAAVDAVASSLGWGDTNTPRALTIFTKSIEALVAVNEFAVRSRRPHCQATIFQVRPLLTDPTFRAAVVHRLEAADPDAASWWRTEFATFGVDALPTVLNPLARLASVPQIRAFLGQPVGTYNARHAMDNRQIVWICPPGTGPTHRLLISLMLRDIHRAAVSRMDMPDAEREPWRLYLDELIALAEVAGEVVAEITEQGRKFALRLHGMTQLLDRIGPAIRTSLLQNASTLSTTSGSRAAVSHITEEWNGRVDPAEVIDLPRFHHYMSFTVGGKRVGPLLIRGASLEEVHAGLARPKKLGQLRRAVNTNSGARPLSELIESAAWQTERVLAFLTGPGKGKSDAVDLTKKGPGGPGEEDEGVFRT